MYRSHRGVGSNKPYRGDKSRRDSHFLTIADPSNILTPYPLTLPASPEETMSSAQVLIMDRSTEPVKEEIPNIEGKRSKASPAFAILAPDRYLTRPTPSTPSSPKYTLDGVRILSLLRPSRQTRPTREQRPVRQDSPAGCLSPCCPFENVRIVDTRVQSISCTSDTKTADNSLSLFVPPFSSRLTPPRSRSRPTLFKIPTRQRKRSSMTLSGRSCRSLLWTALMRASRSWLRRSKGCPAGHEQVQL